MTARGLLVGLILIAAGDLVGFGIAQRIIDALVAAGQDLSLRICR